MSQSLLFGIGVCVFGFTIVGAMVYGRHVFSRFYDAQVATESSLRAAFAVAPTPDAAPPS